MVSLPSSLSNRALPQLPESETLSTTALSKSQQMYNFEYRHSDHYLTHAKELEQYYNYTHDVYSCPSSPSFINDNDYADSLEEEFYMNLLNTVPPQAASCSSFSPVRSMSTASTSAFNVPDLMSAHHHHRTPSIALSISQATISSTFSEDRDFSDNEEDDDDAYAESFHSCNMFEEEQDLLFFPDRISPEFKFKLPDLLLRLPATVATEVATVKRKPSSSSSSFVSPPLENIKRDNIPPPLNLRPHSTSSSSFISKAFSSFSFASANTSTKRNTIPAINPTSTLFSPTSTICGTPTLDELLMPSGMCRRHSLIL